MEAMNKNLQVEATRKEGRLMTVKATMPVWSKIDVSGKLEVKMPFIGGETFCNSESAIEKATEEAFACFCLASERFGRGLEQELVVLGWKHTGAKENGVCILSFGPENETIDNVFDTGYASRLSFNVPDDQLVAA
jgi:hypothetical protein